jgi:glycosyltransferase involved in cell wall biosynthesis
MAALPAARDVGVPAVQTFHSLGGHGRPLRPRSDCMPGRIRVETSLTGLAGRFVATSSRQADELVELGAPRRRVRVVPHGVDTDEFNPTGPILRRGQRSRVVLTGPLLAQLGVDDAVLALAAVPTAELVVAGDFGPRDRNQTRLLDLAVRHRVADRLHLLRQLPGDRMPQLLRSADIVVCVPWHERFGVVALEAMACARPVVASAVGGLADTVVNGVTGAHVPPRRPDALASALREVLGSPTMSQAYGIAGRDRAIARYRWNSIAESTVALYEEAVDEHRR